MTTQAFNLRHDWRLEEVKSLFNQPFNDLLFQAQTVHRKHHNPNKMQLSTLLSIKTGACPEDCKYCPQSGRYNTNLKKEKLAAIEQVLTEAKKAKAGGASRFCMGAAWRNPPKKHIPALAAMIKGVRNLGLETCMTLGMLDQEQAKALADAGLDYYNHNLDTSPDFYDKIITTRTYSDRLATLANVREAGMKVCCGGILGLGESIEDRFQLLLTLANFSEHPESVPINILVPIPGTPLENAKPLDNIAFIRTVAVARIMMPKSYIRFSAGRETLNNEMHMLCYLAGINSIFIGEKLLTTPNPDQNRDYQLFAKLGIQPDKSTTKTKQNINSSLSKSTQTTVESDITVSLSSSQLDYSPCPKPQKSLTP